MSLRELCVFLAGIAFGFWYSSNISTWVYDVTMWGARMYGSYQIADEQRKKQVAMKEAATKPPEHYINSVGVEVAYGKTVLNYVTDGVSGMTYRMTCAVDNYVPTKPSLAMVDVAVNGKTYSLALYKPGEYSYYVDGSVISSSVLLHLLRKTETIDDEIREYALTVTDNDYDDHELTAEQCIVVKGDTYEIKSA